ncbi:MAG: single-stranded DNA-binding protein [Ginsengibacter sp.]|jgi:single-strand DNA-binding protein|nr:single-stranded DNA-binding protein [Hanamia sp.]
MIKLQIIGHLGTDCTTNEVNGRTVINFPVAHSEKYKDAQGNLVEKTTWVRCAYWTDRTGIAQYLKKGQLVYAEGSPEAEGYLNKDNQNAASLKMNVFRIQLLGSSRENQDNSSSSNTNYQASQGNAKVSQPSEMEEPADDLPF